MHDLESLQEIVSIHKNTGLKLQGLITT